jgi:hypothetical protein
MGERKIQYAEGEKEFYLVFEEWKLSNPWPPKKEPEK